MGEKRSTSTCILKDVEPPIGLEPGEYDLSVAIELAGATDHPSFSRAPCSGFPETLAVRSYRANITMQPFHWLDRGVRSDATGLLSQHLFSFAVVGQFVRFDMEEEGIFEQLPGFRYLDIYGTSAGAEPVVAEGSSISVPFKAFFGYCELTSPRGHYSYCGAVPPQLVIDYHACVAERGTMVFTRR